MYNKIIKVGHSSNYAIVVAQLYTQGINRGIHPFIVQIRDSETWMPMPGIYYHIIYIFVHKNPI